MKEIISTLRSRFLSYGHFNISIEVNGENYCSTTTNTEAIDVAFDDCYDDEDNADRLYETRESAQIALVNEILKANNIEL